MATCQFGNRSAHVEGSWLFDALAAFSAGTCRQLKLQYTEMSLCGCNLYETQLLTAAQVMTRPCVYLACGMGLMHAVKS